MKLGARMLSGRHRYFVLFLAFLANVSCPLNCRNMIYAVQPMVNHSAQELPPSEHPNASSSSIHSDTCHGDDAHESIRHEDMPDGPYLFDSKTVALMLSIVAAGQLLGTLFAIVVYDFVYLGPLLSLFMVWIGMLNVATPSLADKGGSAAVVVLRFSVGLYVGLLTPSNNIICDKWFTQKEKNFALTVANVGQNLGCLVFAVAGVVTENLGWEWLFYLPGALSVVTGVLLGVFYTEDPQRSSFMSDGEKKKLAESSGTTARWAEKKKFRARSQFQHRFSVAIARAARRKPAPWFKALKYLQYWALLLGTFGQSWACEATLTYTQIYLSEIHNYSLSKTSLLSAVPTNLSMFLFGLIAAKAGEYFIHQRGCKKVHVRRVGGVLILLTAFYFVALAFLPCEAVDAAIVPLLIFSSLRAGVFVGLVPAFFDISPTYQDTLTTLSMVVGFIPGFIVPFLIGVFGKHRREHWVWMFMISAVIIVVFNGFFVVFIRPRVQSFDDVATTKAAAELAAAAAKKKKDDDAVTVEDYKQREEEATPPAVAQMAAAAWPEGGTNSKAVIWDRVTMEEFDLIRQRLQETIKSVRASGSSAGNESSSSSANNGGAGGGGFPPADATVVEGAAANGKPPAPAE